MKFAYATAAAVVAGIAGLGSFGAAMAAGKALPPLGSAEAAKLPPVDLHVSLPAGPDPRTLNLNKWQRYEPPHNPRNDAARQAALVPGSAKLPMWKAQVTVGTKTYKFSMLGKTVLGTGAKTTKINLVVVPVTFKFNNATFNPARPFKNCSPAAIPTMVAQSPLFQNVTYTAGGINVGTSQFIDLFQRANFWNPYVATNNPGYHLLFNATQGPSYTFTVNGNAAAQSCSAGGKGALGSVDVNSWDNIVQQQLIPDLTSKGYISPSNIPVFLSYDVVYGGAAGYHFIASTANGIQVYGVSVYLDLAGLPPDVEVLSHEVAEFTDDPLTNNKTPAWGHTGQVDGCQANLEVGDPLTGQSQTTVPMPNGFTYTVTDLADFSWFYRESPSIAAAGFYTMLNFFPGPQGKCK
jgi:hypothetical protein